MSFDFANAEAYGAGGVLGRGWHTVRIIAATMGTSRGGYPEIQLETENDEGSLRDWRVITPQSIGWVVGLTDAAGLPRPTGDDVADAETGRLTEAYVAQLVNRWVKVFVVEEPKQGDPTRMVSKVQGYRAPDERTPDTSPVTTGSGAASDFPF